MTGPISLRSRLSILASRIVPGLAALLGAAQIAGCATELSQVPPSAGRPDGWGRPAPPRAEDDEDVPTMMVPVAGVGPEGVPDTFFAERSGGRVHQASDILASRGTPVVSAEDGTIRRVGVNRLGGNMIYATDPSERFVLYYAHLDGYAAGLTAGLKVHRGQVLGYVGTTGNAPKNTPHLHFQLMRRRPDGSIFGGPPIDPRPYLLLPGRILFPDRSDRPDRPNQSDRPDPPARPDGNRWEPVATYLGPTTLADGAP